MPITFRIDPINKRVYSQASGLINYADLLRHMNAEVAPEVASYPELIDCRGASSTMSAGEVRSLANERQRIATNQQPGPVAIVADDDILFGMLRMFDMLTSTVRPIRVFRDLVDAEAWLDSIAGS